MCSRQMPRRWNKRQHEHPVAVRGEPTPAPGQQATCHCCRAALSTPSPFFRCMSRHDCSVCEPCMQTSGSLLYDRDVWLHVVPAALEHDARFKNLASRDPIWPAGVPMELCLVGAAVRVRNGSAEYYHKDVWCDACDAHVVGIRYKCGACVDSDLCASTFVGLFVLATPRLECGCAWAEVMDMDRAGCYQDKAVRACHTPSHLFFRFAMPLVETSRLRLAHADVGCPTPKRTSCWHRVVSLQQLGAKQASFVCVYVCVCVCARTDTIDRLAAHVVTREELNMLVRIEVSCFGDEAWDVREMLREVDFSECSFVDVAWTVNTPTKARAKGRGASPVEPTHTLVPSTSVLCKHGDHKRDPHIDPTNVEESKRSHEATAPPAARGAQLHATGSTASSPSSCGGTCESKSEEESSPWQRHLLQLSRRPLQSLCGYVAYQKVPLVPSRSSTRRQQRLALHMRPITEVLGSSEARRFSALYVCAYHCAAGNSSLACSPCTRECMRACVLIGRVSMFDGCAWQLCEQFGGVQGLSATRRGAHLVAPRVTTRSPPPFVCGSWSACPS